MINARTSSARQRRSARGARRGVVSVEFALVAPILFSLIFLFIEFDRYAFAVAAMEEAARGGCRAAIPQGATSPDVANHIQEILGPAGVGTYAYEVTPNLTSDFKQGELITVTITANYKDISWLPTPSFLNDKSIRVSCTLPKEG